MNAPQKQDRFLEHFDQWFRQHKKLEGSPTWYAVILEECGNSEAALLKSWEYLDIFNVEVSTGK